MDPVGCLHPPHTQRTNFGCISCCSQTGRLRISYMYIYCTQLSAIYPILTNPENVQLKTNFINLIKLSVAARGYTFKKWQRTRHRRTRMKIWRRNQQQVQSLSCNSRPTRVIFGFICFITFLYQSFIVCLKVPHAIVIVPAMLTLTKHIKEQPLMKCQRQS